MWFISFILMTTLTPFVSVDQKSAANDLKDGFKDSSNATENVLQGKRLITPQRPASKGGNPGQRP